MTIDELKADIAGLQKQLRVETDYEQRVLLQLDLAHLRQKLQAAEKQ